MDSSVYVTKMDVEMAKNLFLINLCSKNGITKDKIKQIHEIQMDQPGGEIFKISQKHKIVWTIIASHKLNEIIGEVFRVEYKFCWNKIVTII